MRRLLLLCATALLVSCERGPATAPAAGTQAPVEDWRVVVQLPNAELPVRLHLAADDSEAWFVNGRERVEVAEIRRQRDAVVLRLPAFNNTLRLQRTAMGYRGSLTLVKRGYEQVMALSAEPYEGFRFVRDARPAVDVTGRWEVVFTDDEGKLTPAVGEFDQQGAVLTGTFLLATGDYRFLAGEVDGRDIHLSTFDGAHAFVFSATALEDGRLAGDFWSGTRWHERWVARRNFDAALPDAFSLTHLKVGYDRLAFSFPDLDGKFVSLADEKYAGKVVLVSLAGTWCPNCADEAEFLARFHHENRDRGLEVIMLLYEHFEEFARAARQGRALRDKHGIDFDILVAGSSDKTRAAETLPMLNHLLAFPTLIFVDRAGRVRGIHTGFSGPGTGRHYTEFKQKFTALVERLLEERVPDRP
jgi:peroxiredoxin